MSSPEMFFSIMISSQTGHLKNLVNWANSALCKNYNNLLNVSEWIISMKTNTKFSPHH